MRSTWSSPSPHVCWRYRGLSLAGANVPGWTSLAVLMSLLGGIELLVLGMMGEYIARIFEEVKNRPLYIVRHTEGIDATTRLLRARSVVVH